MKKTKKEIIEIILQISEELGMFIDYDKENDFDLSMYFPDSISFISFIVSLEDALETEFPDDLLYIEKYASFEKIVDIIYEIL